MSDHSAGIAAAGIFQHLGGGFPHSEITGSKDALASPVLIAECHVFHRLLPPRHPLDALLTLDLISETHVQSKARQNAWTASHGSRSDICWFLADRSFG
jgi:hypothetical protein